MAKTGIVTDSTCDFGPAWFRDHDVAWAPLKVNFGDTTYLDWIDLTPETFFEMLKNATALPKTSQPSPADFAAVYQQLADDGYDEIVSIHLSAALSGTMESALMAAAEASIPVRVVDTRSVNMGAGLALIGAIEARDAGGDAAAIEAAAINVRDHGRLLFALDTLEYLVKGGRAGKAAGLAASILNIKPVLTINRDGIIEPFAKVKGTRKALVEMATAAAEAAAGGRIRVALLHSMAPDLADELKSELDAKGISYELAAIAEVGAVIGTYAGPRAVGIAFYPLS